MFDDDPVPVEVDVWGVDAAYSATQKCLGAVSGLAPITFSDREVGGSKMSKSIVLEAIWKVPVLRLRGLFHRL